MAIVGVVFGTRDTKGILGHFA